MDSAEKLLAICKVEERERDYVIDMPSLRTIVLPSHSRLEHVFEILDQLGKTAAEISHSGAVLGPTVQGVTETITENLPKPILWIFSTAATLISACLLTGFLWIFPVLVTKSLPVLLWVGFARPTLGLSIILTNLFKVASTIILSSLEMLFRISGPVFLGIDSRLFLPNNWILVRHYAFC